VYKKLFEMENHEMADYDEIDAMKKIAEALEPLEDAARLRALQWALSRFRGGGSVRDLTLSPPRSEGPALDVDGSASSFTTIAEQIDASEPRNERDPDHEALNEQLKDLGHRVGNITDALTQLRDDRPALALQLKKSGTSKQARKTYKLTQEGIRRVQAMIKREPL
jgi:hypothetical protein